MFMFRRNARNRARNDVNGKALDDWSELSKNHGSVDATKDQLATDSERTAATENSHPAEARSKAWRSTRSLSSETNYIGKEYVGLQKKGTEGIRSSHYEYFFPQKGYFECRACELPLYGYEAKFDAEMGYPTFGEHIEGHVEAKPETLCNGKKRICLCCARCKSHLGTVFFESNPSRYDPYKTFRERQCVNGFSIKYVKQSLPKGLNPHGRSLGGFKPGRRIHF